jgi:DNA-binding MarR family transcriptional regulator
VVNDLAAAGLVEFAVNPHHRRARLVRHTAAGSAAYERATARQIPWSRALAEGLALSDLRSAAGLLRRLADRLSGSTTDFTHRQGAD